MTVGYAVKEIFKTLQGEGAHCGRAAVFCRFAGCNLWSGREEDRANALCTFCDTDFIGMDGANGGRFRTAGELADVIERTWGGTGGKPYVVCTGGEPLLQLNEQLIEELHARGFEVAVETNGTQSAPSGLDWVCVSPKAGTTITLRVGSELKVVYPQSHLDFDELETWDFRYFFIQPMDGPDARRNLKLATQYCLENPKWRLSLQTHKILGIP
jgi:7-carboxy-7-deazaguanine synthase (Cx14CxxC type)